MSQFALPRFAVGIAFLAGLLSVSSVRGDDWVTIFDGKSDKGWVVPENPKSFKVEDGAFVSNGNRSHAYYVADKPFVNFEFEAEVLTKDDSNGGIFFHTKEQKEGWPGQGYECQVNNSKGKDPQKTGGLYNTVKIAEPPAKDNEWFKYYIKVDGKHVTVKINDKVVVDYDQPADKEKEPKLGSGTFALQAHDPGSTVLYKNIKVKRLP